MKVTENNIHIDDSYLIRKKHMIPILEGVKEVYPDCLVTQYRSMLSMKLEWCAHNFLYKIGVATARTKDVDIDYPQPLKMRIGYAIGGLIGWLFIK